MITKLNLYNESILIPRNLEGRKEKLHQEYIKLLQQDVIDGDLIITKEILSIPSELIKAKQINGNLVCVRLNLIKLPEWFKNIELIKGSFWCNGNELTTLENCPQNITGAFNCYHNKLTSLEYGPKYVGLNYHCFGNSIKLKKPEDCNIVGKFIN